MADQPQIVVSPTTITNVLAAGTRMLSVLIGGGIAVMGFLSKHDLAGLADYFKSSAFVPVAGALAAVGSFAFAMYRTWKNKKSLIAVAHAAPDEVATVLAPKQ